MNDGQWQRIALWLPGKEIDPGRTASDNRYAKLNDRAFNEKQAAYVGLLEAYHRAAAERTDEAAKTFAYWQMRCDLLHHTRYATPFAGSSKRTRSAPAA